jgi:hypothetical protein
MMLDRGGAAISPDAAPEGEGTIKVALEVAGVVPGVSLAHLLLLCATY